MGDSRGEFRGLMETPDGQKQLGKPRRRRKNNIKIDVQELRWDMDWIYLPQDWDKWHSLVNTVMNLRVHKMQEIS